MEKKIDRRTFLVQTTVLSGSLTLGGSVLKKTARAAENKAINEREFLLEKQYLNLPVSYDEDHRVGLELVIDDNAVRHLDVFLPDSEPDFWVFVDVSEFKGKKALLRTKRGRKKKGLSLVYQSDEREYLKNVYKEKHRPQLHFSTMRGWINDHSFIFPLCGAG
jgi:hypothetical protein